MTLIRIESSEGRETHRSRLPGEFPRPWRSEENQSMSKAMSLEQIAANRANAQKSIGRRPPKGGNGAAVLGSTGQNPALRDQAGAADVPALVRLERLQRLRRGEAVPAPLTVEVSERLGKVFLPNEPIFKLAQSH
jgi:hypothetical protein